jgi:hypothetical protein
MHQSACLTGLTRAFEVRLQWVNVSLAHEAALRVLSQSWCSHWGQVLSLQLMKPYDILDPCVTACNRSVSMGFCLVLGVDLNRTKQHNTALRRIDNTHTHTHTLNL